MKLSFLLSITFLSGAFVFCVLKNKKKAINTNCVFRANKSSLQSSETDTETPFSNTIPTYYIPKGMAVFVIDK